MTAVCSREEGGGREREGSSVVDSSFYPQIPQPRKRKLQDMSTSSLLTPLQSSPLPPSKRSNMGIGREEVGGGGEWRREDMGGRGGYPEKEHSGKEQEGTEQGRGKEGGKKGEEGKVWPEWGDKMLGGRGDPGAEYRMIQDISNERVSKENPQQCYLSAGINKTKNRYKDVLPYEQTRVRLREGIENDYINANFVQGVLGYRYISTQAPLAVTIGDFCQMIWEQEISTILMLTRIIEKKTIKAYQYWPCQVGGVDQIGVNFSLKLISEKVHDCGYVCVRRLEICRRGAGEEEEEKREIIHMHYTEWPDYGIPSSNSAIRTLLHITDTLHKEQQSQRQGPPPPTLVHCSAGIGRAGTFIALHQAIKQIEAKIERNSLQGGGLKEGKREGEREESFDVASIKDIVLSLREQRRGMVQTKDQYCVIYRVAEDVLFGLLKSPDRSRPDWKDEKKAVALFLDSCRVAQPQPQMPQITSMEDYQNQVGMKFSSALQHNNDHILPLIEEDEEEIEYEDIEEEFEEDDDVLC